MTIQEFKKNAISLLSGSSPSPALDTDVLLEYCLNLTKTQLLLKAREELPAEKEIWLNSAIEARKTGLPVAYITGHKEFYGYDFIVSPSVLIPKPDTEILVERAVEVTTEKIEVRPNSVLSICDMCTGSGCIGLSVLRTLIEVYKVPYEKLPKFTMVDISEPALEVARKNLEKMSAETKGALPADRVRFVRSNLFEQVPWSFDLILTNPPYIPRSMVDELLQDGRNEPRLALDGDVFVTRTDEHFAGESSDTDDGLTIIKELIPQAKKHLNPLGTILMETGEYNAKAAALLAQNYGFKSNIHKDLEDQLRVVELN